MSLRRYLLISCVVAPFAASAQRAGGVRVLSNQQVSIANPRTPHFETHLAVNPSDPRHLIAAALVASADSMHRSNVYVTFDGGKRWTSSVRQHPSLIRG